MFYEFMREVIKISKIILDLCGGTGSWSKPYKDAGYDVRVISYPQHDIRCYAPPVGVYGVLAAPPCTYFSLVRNTPKEPRNLRIAMDTVEHCLRIIWECQIQGKLQFWALENPRGLLRQFIGKPAYSFCPSEFGEEYNKKTDIWGYFNEPVKIREKQKKDSIAIKNIFHELPSEFIKDPFMRKDAICRSITPPGFAKAFFEANQ